MSRLVETVCGNDVEQMKRYAFKLKMEFDEAGWFKKISIKQNLKSVLNEIDYHEGRLQYANRPYSFPTEVYKKCTNNTSCKCGCWNYIRMNFFKL